jgi:hypothetical protein
VRHEQEMASMKSEFTRMCDILSQHMSSRSGERKKNKGGDAKRVSKRQRIAELEKQVQALLL